VREKSLTLKIFFFIIRQFNVEQIDKSFIIGKFKDTIEDCQNAQWYFLKQTVYTKGSLGHFIYVLIIKDFLDESCSYCHDFCLPDYAVIHSHTLIKHYINISQYDFS
jgi:hypothetical protein